MTANYNMNRFIFSNIFNHKKSFEKLFSFLIYIILQHADYYE